jgi:gliding motility-associated-like protein
MRQRLIAVIACLTSMVCYGQDFSNKGKDFWVGYGFHARMNTTANSQNMVLYFTSDVNANVKVEIPLLGYSTTYTVKANQVTETAPLPKSGAQDARLMKEGISNSGIHITSDAPVVAYAHIYDGSVSGASLLFPTNTLGQDYYTLGFTQGSNEDNSNAYAFVVATEDNTTVEITPSAKTLTHDANKPFTVSLSKGQIFNLMGATTGGSGIYYTGVDLSGTRVRSISSGSNSCKKIAVYCGSGKLNIACNPTGNNSSDNIIQQVFPSSAWGRKYVTSQTRFMVFNYYRVMIKDPGTVVKLNGVTLTNLIAGRYYEFSSSTENVIEADKPILVAQYMTTSFNCGNTVLGTDGDPEMIYLSPVEQTISNITLNSTSKFAIKYHFINVIIPKSKMASFKLDGVSQISQFNTHAADPNYASAQIKVNAGSHHLTADTGFNAIAYGMGSYESYGYNAGTNIIDLYQKIESNNLSTGYKLPVTCRTEKFNFTVTIPYMPTAVTWDFYNNPLLSDASPEVIMNPTPDSSYQKDGRTLYVFKMKKALSYNGTGEVPVRVFLQNPTSDGCSGLQEINYVMTVVEKPKPDFSVVFSGCQKDTAFFKENINVYQQQLTSFKWTVSDGYTTSAKQFTKYFPSTGTFTVNLKIGNDIGCFSDSTQTIKAGATPSTKFITVGSNCTEQNITFTDQSSSAESPIVKWSWNYGNGTGDILSQNLPRTVQYAKAGDYVISLITETAAGCKDTLSKNLSVKTRPIAKFSAPNVCMSDAFAQFFDSSYLANNSTGTLSYAWNFGDANATPADNVSSLQSPKHKYTTTGNYKVALIVSSGSGCSDTASQTINVNGSIPKADFTAVVNKVCSNQPVQIKNTSTIDFGTFSKVEIIWDNDNAPAVVETDASPEKEKTYTHQYPSFNSPASKTYRVKMRVYSGGTCMNEIIKDVTVYAAPKVVFDPIAPICIDNGTKQINTASETSGNTGSFAFFGKGVSATGVIDPKSAGVGTTAVTYVFTSVNGCTDSAKQKITIVAAPKAAFNFNNPTCGNIPITFSDHSTDNASITSRQWNFGDGTTQSKSDSTSFTKQYDKAGTYTVSLIVADQSGCGSDTAVKQIVIHAAPVVNFSVPASLCFPNAKADFKDLSTIEDNSQALFTYVWNFGDGSNNSVMKNPSHTYTTAGAKTITLTVTSKDGCSSVGTRSISDIYAQPKSKLSADKTEICANEQINFTDNSTGANGSIVTSSWLFGTGATTTGAAASYTYANGGEYTVAHFYTDEKGCMSDTSSVKIKVHNYPTVNAGDDVLVPAGSSVQLKPIVSGNILKHVWKPLNNLSDLNITVKVTNNVVYTLEVVGQGNCAASDDVEVKILAAPKVPNVFSPNGDGIHDQWIIPNLDSYKECTVEVFDRYGTQVYGSKGYNKPWDGTYKGQPLPYGTYYYIIDTKLGNAKLSGYITILR